MIPPPGFNDAVCGFLLESPWVACPFSVGLEVWFWEVDGPDGILEEPDAEELPDLTIAGSSKGALA